MSFLADRTDWYRSGSGLIVPEDALPERLPLAVDLFAGGGGFSLGVHQAGFHVVAAVEFDPWAAITYMVNLATPGVQIHFDTDERRKAFSKASARHMGVKIDKDGYVVQGKPAKERNPQGGLNPAGVGLTAGQGWLSHYECPEGAHGGEHEGIGYDGQHNDYLAEINSRPTHPYGCEHFWVADARNVTGAEILAAIGADRGDVALVMGGPPCQGFSTSNSAKRAEKVMDPRNSLVFEFMRIALEIAPKAICMENVPAMANMVTPEGIPVVDALARMMEDGDMGDFKRLRTSLMETAGLKPGMAMRGKKVTRSRDSHPEPETDAPQGSLFAGATS